MRDFRIFIEIHMIEKEVDGNTGTVFMAGEVSKIELKPLKGELFSKRAQNRKC
jgi:hypothetical protein